MNLHKTKPGLSSHKFPFWTVENVRGGAISVDFNGTYISANIKRLHGSPRWSNASNHCWFGFGAWNLWRCHWVIHSNCHPSSYNHFLSRLFRFCLSVTKMQLFIIHNAATCYVQNLKNRMKVALRLAQVLLIVHISTMIRKIFPFIVHYIIRKYGHFIFSSCFKSIHRSFYEQ